MDISSLAQADLFVKCGCQGRRLLVSLFGASISLVVFVDKLGGLVWKRRRGRGRFVGRKKGRVCTRPSAGSGSESLDGGGGIELVENLAGILVRNFEGAEHLARRKEPVDTELNLGIPMAQHGEPIDAEFIAADGIDFPLGLFVP